MALGNVWHIPESAEPRTVAAMRSPAGAIVPGTAVTIYTGNQFQGAGNPGDQLLVGSALFVKGGAAVAWTEIPMAFHLQDDGNNKYYRATIPAFGFKAGELVRYYLRIAYADHDTTFVHADSATTGDEAVAQGAPFSYLVQTSERWGEWAPVFRLRNVGAHASVLPTGSVLFWGRRNDPAADPMDVASCTPFLLDPASTALADQRPTPSPRQADGAPANLFCAGHTFLADGRLFVMGGHIADSEGLDQSCVYDPFADTWTADGQMNRGRWYPSATTLPDGGVLAMAGSFGPAPNHQNNDVAQVWRRGQWTSLPQQRTLPLYPRAHVTSAGTVIVTGSNPASLFLDVATGAWTPGPTRQGGLRDYAPSVMYDVDRIIYLGGGNGDGDPDTQEGDHAPTARTELLDLRAPTPAWVGGPPMVYPRRQHNATLLPDGTVLVTGGTRGGGPPDNGFNDVGAGAPVHAAELWDPATGAWTELAAEDVDRCYHAVAVLLPDATVLSAGGGEWKPGGTPNVALDSHLDAQVFSPPYLFAGPRPQIGSAPEQVAYGAAFTVGTDAPGDIEKVSLVGLSSVTHSVNLNQRITFLTVTARTPDGLTLTAPPSANVWPPGFAMLFLVSRAGVPSVARFVRVGTAADQDAAPAFREASVPTTLEPATLEPAARQAERHVAERPPVLVGLQGTCPYGIAACWGGAYAALSAMDRVVEVDRVPNAVDSTAGLYLAGDALPDLDRWIEQFHAVANASYAIRGFEITLRGTLSADAGGLALDGAGRARVRLVPLAATAKIQWDAAAGAPQEPTPREARAFTDLAGTDLAGTGALQATVTGPLLAGPDGYRLAVRVFEVGPPAPA